MHTSLSVTDPPQDVKFFIVDTDFHDQSGLHAKLKIISPCLSFIVNYAQQHYNEYSRLAMTKE